MNTLTHKSNFPGRFSRQWAGHATPRPPAGPKPKPRPKPAAVVAVAGPPAVDALQLVRDWERARSSGRGDLAEECMRQLRRLASRPELPEPSRSDRG